MFDRTLDWLLRQGVFRRTLLVAGVFSWATSAASWAILRPAMDGVEPWQGHSLMALVYLAIACFIVNALSEIWRKGDPRGRRLGIYIGSAALAGLVFQTPFFNSFRVVDVVAGIFAALMGLAGMCSPRAVNFFCVSFGWPISLAFHRVGKDLSNMFRRLSCRKTVNYLERGGADPVEYGLLVALVVVLVLAAMTLFPGLVPDWLAVVVGKK